jgi:predicted SnoaL-like aldol condensation-catalyzing enzyme
MSDQLEENKRIVREFHDLAFNQRQPEAATAKYLSPNYRQHNPGAGNGPESFISFIKWFVQTYPAIQVNSKRMIAEGNLVVTHSHIVREPGDRGMAVMDIHRIEGGKIVEHWDVVQEIPETSKNNNTMF